MKHVRNVAIIVVIALAVVALPGGTDVADLVGAAFGLLFAALLAYFAGRFYRDHQVDIYGLRDADRALVYVALGGIVVVFAAWKFDSTVGWVASLAALALCAGAIVRVYRNWQRY
jgi:O-antigen/teichoic acid export membrane protein